MTISKYSLSTFIVSFFLHATLILLLSISFDLRQTIIKKPVFFNVQIKELERIKDDSLNQVDSAKNRKKKPRSKVNDIANLKENQKKILNKEKESTSVLNDALVVEKNQKKILNKEKEPTSVLNDALVLEKNQKKILNKEKEPTSVLNDALDVEKNKNVKGVFQKESYKAPSQSNIKAQSEIKKRKLELEQELKSIIRIEAQKNYPRISKKKLEEGSVKAKIFFDNKGNFLSVEIMQETNATKRIIESFKKTVKNLPTRVNSIILDIGKQITIKINYKL